MYTFFMTQVTKGALSPTVRFIPKQITMHPSVRLCSFCNFCRGKISKLVMCCEFHSSTSSINLVSYSLRKKKINPRRKKKTELLKDKTTNKIDMYTNEECQKLYDDKIDSNIENNTDVLHNNRTCFGDSYANIDEFLHNTKINDNVLKTKEKIIRTKRSIKTSPRNTKSGEKVKKSETEEYVSTMLACMQTYLSCGLLDMTNNVFLRYKRSLKGGLGKYNNSIELYNTLLEAYASQGEYTKVLELYNMIKEDCIKPTPQTYAYMLDALGRQTPENREIIKLLKNLMTEMKKFDVSFNDVFCKSYFRNDQQTNILNVVKLIRPNFKPKYVSENTTYTCNVLKNFPCNNYPSPVMGLVTMKDLNGFLERQLQIELGIEVTIKSIFTKEEDHSKLKKQFDLETQWRNVLLTAFDMNIKYLKKRECARRAQRLPLYPFLKLLDKEEYVNTMLKQVKLLLEGSEAYSDTVGATYQELGNYIFRKYEIQTNKRTGVLDTLLRTYRKYLEWYLHPNNTKKLDNMNDRIVWSYFGHEEEKHGASLGYICKRWPKEKVYDIGRFLLNIILKDVTFENEKGENIPVFYRLYRHNGKSYVEQIKPHPTMSKLYKESILERVTFQSTGLPSYAPPRPWTSMDSGGYLITSIPIVKIHPNSYPMERIKVTSPEQLHPVYDSLNQLGSIPWSINCPILDIIIEIFKNGGSKELDVPQAICGFEPPSVSQNATFKEKRDAMQALAAYQKEKNKMYSLWCETLYRLVIANHFRNTHFWLPQHMDFRGRVYPIAPALNHLGNDLVRSLLLFANGKPLGANGFDWLKLHLINLTNAKKGTTVKERLEYANQNLENMIDSATNPLKGKMWWTKSENPWQTLAVCMEVAKALKAPNIEEYVSRVPIHQDGSCNGLQHYAALGRDKTGAKSVNLCPTNVPRDVYTEVASQIEQLRVIDAKRNIKVALLLEGFVKRSVIKRTVMTTVYGVTQYGAKNQIMKQLDDDHFPNSDTMYGAVYLVEKTFLVLKSLFKNAKTIQDWLTDCARIISADYREPVQWITPIGLPVIQPYNKVLKFASTVPDKMKQRNAFAPNFIHSLDATHMMLTSLYCQREGICFVSVHDSFWTHACTVDIMNRVCREQFVNLHCEPILEHLAKHFVQVFPSSKVPEEIRKDVTKRLTSVPARGSFDINNVLSSTHFFS